MRARLRRARVAWARRAVKALLLHQAFSAGVGNWVADEVLYQSRIHPEQPANSLTAAQVADLHRHIAGVCRVASDAGADAARMPQDWLFHHRWGKGAKTKSKVAGHTIEHVTVGGRTSAYVPALQKLDRAAAAAAARGKGKAGKTTAAAPRSESEGGGAEEAPAPKRARLPAIAKKAAAAASAPAAPARRKPPAPAARAKAAAPRAAAVPAAARSAARLTKR
jgi:formamidopyrimidine-DNA glycosylase